MGYPRSIDNMPYNLVILVVAILLGMVSWRSLYVSQKCAVFLRLLMLACMLLILRCRVMRGSVLACIGSRWRGVCVRLRLCLRLMWDACSRLTLRGGVVPLGMCARSLCIQCRSQCRLCSQLLTVCRAYTPTFRFPMRLMNLDSGE